MLVEFDPNVVAVAELVAKFFASHNPAQRASQKNQYNARLWFEEGAKEEVDAAVKAYKKAHPGLEVRTEITAGLPTFHIAENYHQKYLDRSMLSGNRAAAPERDGARCVGGVCGR